MNNNEVAFEMTLDTAWQEEPLNSTQWVQDFCTRRYGLNTPELKNGSEAARDAWKILSVSRIASFFDSIHHPASIAPTFCDLCVC